MRKLIPVTAAVAIVLTRPTVGAAPLGFPDRSPDVDVLPGFREPHRGYGNVPFYWWNGDPLTRERLLWQLNELDAAGTDGFGVSYIHSHPQADPETWSTPALWRPSDAPLGTPGTPD